MFKNKIKILISIAIMFMMAGGLIAEEGKSKKGSGLNKTTGVPVRAFLNINNISTVIKNEGTSDIDVAEQNSGLTFPKGSGKQAVFISGLLWGVKIPGDDQVRVGGSAYSPGLQPGKILSPGVFEDPSLPHVRIYRVRPDWETGDLSSEFADEGGSIESIREQYGTDWNEWPAEDGAPYEDVDGNGSYDPNVDIPGFPGADQTIWYVANDLNDGLTTNLYGTQPIGMEMQATFWAYKQQGALGNMFFRKYRLINKSETPFDSVYLSMWSDVDIGNSSDDFAGCDTTLSLGYCYNAAAVDPTYSPLPPPAVGFDFFQGPLLDGVAGEDKNKNGIDDSEDYAIFDGKRVGPGKINLPMTSFYYFARGDASVADPTTASAQGSTQFYNFFQGRIGLTGDFFVDPNTNLPTTFALAGDPQTRTGWIDGQSLNGGDRRIGMASGPFTMAVADTQEIVVAEICAGAIPGVDRIAAIGLLKFYDQTAQKAYDDFFDLAVPPVAPVVTVAEQDKQIVLNWGGDQVAVHATESSDEKGYAFQGYNVYQLPSPSASVSEGKRIATFDIADGVLKIEDQFFDPSTGVVATGVRQFGNDTEIQRFLSITTDELRGGVPLVNGNRYYFAVTSYSYNPDPAAIPNNLENPLQVITVIPQSKNPGAVFGGGIFDTLAVTHSPIPADGGSDGNVYPIVVDPALLTGLDYKVSFEDVNGEVVWHLDRSDGVRLLENQTNQNADAESPIVDGLQIRVIGAPLDVKAIDMTANGNGPIIGGLETYEITPAPTDIGGSISADWYRDVLTSPHGGALDLDAMQANGGYYFIVAGSQSISDHEAAVNRWTRDGANFPLLIPNNYEMRFTEAGGMGVWVSEFHDNLGGTYPVPFELWYLGSTLEDPSDDVRMIPVILDEADTVGTPVPPTWGFQLDHEASGGNNDPSSDWVYWYMPGDESPGDAGYQAAIAANPTTRGDDWHEHFARMVVMNWNQFQGAGGVEELPETGTVFRIRFTIPNAAGVDEFAFSTEAAKIDNNLAKNEIGKINVYPNPYYAVNTEEINKYNRFVTFTHLPAKAKIRIFNLAGVLVKTIDKDDTGQFQRWDLANESGLPVASGLYIAHIDMPDLGKSKILKVAVVQEQQILDRF
jgi:hypothetical protein